jgi:Xaa-Pro aminopeptidase
MHAHANPGATPITQGELLRLDVGSRYDGYHSDVARMAVGEAPSKIRREIYKNLREIQRSTIAQMKPGVRACDVFNHCAKAFEEKGMAFNMPHIGHGLGIGLHEYPMIEPGNTIELQAGMVINIEPLYLDKNVGCFHIEDLSHITDEGPVILSDYLDTTELFGIR